MATAATTVFRIKRNSSEHEHREDDGHDDGERRAAIGRADKSQRGEPDKDPRDRYLAVADQGENHGSRQMRSDHARARYPGSARDRKAAECSPPSTWSAISPRTWREGRQHDPVIAKHAVDPARILQQQTNDDEGKAAINDDDAVAQGIEPVQANVRERAREDQGHQRNQQDGRQRRQRAGKSAGPKKDDDSGEKGDLAHIERREAEIGEALPHQGIAQQHDRKQREIPIAPQRRAGILF